MITRITGVLEGVEGLEATVVPTGSAMAFQVLLPAYLAQRLRESRGQSVTFHTITYFEGQLGGSHLVPRLIGFASAPERRFFELMTSVEGLGNRKALKALAQEPAAIARAIASSDATWLTGLPEIGKKTAEKVILELKSKVQGFLSAEEVAGLDAAATGAAPKGAEGQLFEDAIAALMALGETRADAERKVRLAMSKRPGLKTADELVAAVYGG